MPQAIGGWEEGSIRSAVRRGGRHGSARGARLPLWVLLLGVATAAGCAGKAFVVEAVEEGDPGRLRHRELGYRIALPALLGQPGWSREDLEQSDLLIRHRDGSAWALASHCRSAGTPVGLLAAELARAARAGGQARGEPLQHAGLEGFVQRLEAREDGAMLPIKTVTLRGARCTFDWILVAPTTRRLEELEGAFDAWWQSFEPGPRDRLSGERP